MVISEYKDFYKVKEHDARQHLNGRMQVKVQEGGSQAGSATEALFEAEFI